MCKSVFIDRQLQLQSRIGVRLYNTTFVPPPSQLVAYPFSYIAINRPLDFDNRATEWYFKFILLRHLSAISMYKPIYRQQYDTHMHATFRWISRTIDKNCGTHWVPSSFNRFSYVKRMKFQRFSQRCKNPKHSWMSCHKREKPLRKANINRDRTRNSVTEQKKWAVGRRRWRGGGGEGGWLNQKKNVHI